MRQAVLVKPHHIELHDVAPLSTADLKDNEILLAIKRIGVCGSDIHSFHGQHPSCIYPIVQGHEYSGEVVAVGKDVTVVKVGDKATARPQQVCGECAPCRRGQYNVCQNLKVEGFHAPGCAQDLFIVPEDRVVFVPESVSFDYAAMIEPVAVAAHASNRPRDIKGKNVVVSGAGTIGNLIAQFAKARGAKKVAITDVSDLRLDIALQCGIDGVLNVAKRSLADAVDELFDGEGFQVGFECAGVESSIRSLMSAIEKGSDVIIVGVHAKDPAIDMEVLGEHELYLIGSLMYLHEDYIEAVENVATGKICLTPLITNHFPLEQYMEAYEFIDANREGCMKVIIDL